MNIIDILSENTISFNVEAKNKEQLLDEMMELVSKSSKVLDKDKAKKEILQRESIMSTGVGKGIALPHAKTNTVTDSIGALAVLKNKVDYNSLDSKPVDIVFLLLGKEKNVGTHLLLLSKISRLMNNEEVKQKIKNAGTPDKVLEIFNELKDN